MEDFEDDFDYRGEFVRYFPTYQAMNDAQLRGYFSSVSYTHLRAHET